MPDLLRIFLSMVAAGSVAAFTVLFFGCLAPRRQSWTSFSGVLGIAFGGLVGMWILGLFPHLSLLEDRDRLLLILFPALVTVEFFGVWFERFAWVFRWILGAIAASVLLHNTVYIADLSGPGTRQWSDMQALVVLSGLAWALISAWALLGKCVSSPMATGLPVVYFLTALGVALSVMLSGYATAGQLGFLLAAVILGSSFGIRIFDPHSNFTGIAGSGLLGVFSLLVMGRFFGALSNVNAILLFVAPILAGVVILISGRIKSRKLRPMLIHAIAAIPIAVAVALAYGDFLAASGPEAAAGTPKVSNSRHRNMSR